MIPRARIFFLPRSADLKETIQACKQTGYTRIPVYDGHRDDVVGILHVRDLISNLPDTDKAIVDPMKWLRKPYFVSANRLVSTLFQSFKEKNHSLAMVVDEFGGLVGMVTMHDLLETIFGPLHGDWKEIDVEVPKPLANGCYQLEGVISVEEFMRMTACGPLEGVSAETMGGVVLDVLGELPEPGQKVRVADWELTVHEVENNRITTLLACQVDRHKQDSPPAPDARASESNTLNEEQ